MRVIRKMLFALAALAALAPVVLAWASPAHAEKRVALVIGNSSYVHVPRLANPVNDARLMADTLRSLGFALVGNGPQLNLDENGLRRAVRDFGLQLQGAEVALFYYAGHALEVRGSNYLVPVGANPTREVDVDFQMFDVKLVLRQMEGAGTKLNIVMLDACRNNPFAGRGLRATGGGLAQMQAPEGTLISYATQPNSVANDGVGDNSPYTKALVQMIRKPGLDIFRTFNEVGLAVASATSGQQQPWVSNSPIKGEFYFTTPPAPGAPSAGPVPPPDAAAQAWAVVQNTTSIAVLETFIKQYGGSFYGEVARARLAELTKSQVAVVAPPATGSLSASSKSGWLVGIVDGYFGSSRSEPAGPPGKTNKQVAVASPPVTPASGSDQCGGGAVTVSLSSRTAQPLSASEEHCLKPKDSFKECDHCPEMVVVPAGSFTMGSPESETGRFINGEGPQHIVTFANAFAVGRFAVTFDEWDACVANGGCNGYRPNDQRWGRGRLPVIDVSWNDAQAYVAWLSGKTGKTYRLLSEAEREYVTRAGTTTPFWWGTSISTNQANYDGTYVYGDGQKGEFRARTVPVDSFRPNLWGLYQVHGNAWEWVQDCYNGSYREAPPDGSAWIDGSCNYRIRRGGSWNYFPSSLRAANRDMGFTYDRANSIGFRVARKLSQ